MGVDCFVYLPRMSMRFDLNARGNYMGYQSGEEAVCDGRDRSRPGGEAAGLNEREKQFADSIQRRRLGSYIKFDYVS